MGILIKAIVLFVRFFCAASVVILIMLISLAQLILLLPPKSPGGKSRNSSQTQKRLADLVQGQAPEFISGAGDISLSGTISLPKVYYASSGKLMGKVTTDS